MNCKATPFNLTQYLGEHFPELFLHPPLFYRWSIALRFDLCGRATTAQETDVVIQRASALYRANFPVESMTVVVAQDWPGDESQPEGLSHLSPLFVFATREDIGISGPDGHVSVTDPEDADAGPHTLSWVRQPSERFGHARVFEGIANADHGRLPAISSRVYLINPDSNVILHMYDDRGLDVIASSREAVYRLYHDFNAWLLEYDRARMEQTFA